MMDVPRTTESQNPAVKDNFAKALELFDSGTDRDTMVSLLRENCRLGDAASMVLLGMALKDGTDEERRESVDLFGSASELEYASGTRNLAYCYAVGINVDKDKTRGAELYRRAMEQGSAAAACNLGVMYDYGNGVPQDFYKAFECYTIAAENGNTRGMTNLGEFYNFGKGISADLYKAEMWYVKSGSPRAKYRLALLFLDYPGREDRERALALLKESADAGYGKALIRYGDEIGGEESIRYYNIAAERGYPEAVQRLTDLGLPVPEPKRRRA